LHIIYKIRASAQGRAASPAFRRSRIFLDLPDQLRTGRGEGLQGG
jgi:hypothetical protein